MRNVRAVRGDVALRHGRREEVRLEEVTRISARKPARLLTATAERLDLPEGSVDAVVGTLVLCSVDDQAQALFEILRVLKPGGRYVFIEHVAVPLGPRTRRIQEMWTPMLQHLPGGCSPNRETRRATGRAGFGAVVDERFELPVFFGIALPHIAGTATK